MAARTSRTAHADGPLAAASDDTLIGRSVTIARPRQALYQFWRHLENLPRFMHNIHEVIILDELRSRWRIAAPAGQTVEWLALITADEPGRLIAWRSEAGASIRNSGQIEFRDSTEGRGTVVTVTIAYDPPAGSFGGLAATLFHREPKLQARQDLRRFKQLMETGEVATAMPPETPLRPRLQSVT